MAEKILVDQLLNKGGLRPHHIVDENTSVHSCLLLLARADVGALLVGNDQALVGIFSERDYARKVILLGKNSTETRVGDVMTRDVVFVTPNVSLEDSLEAMVTHGIRHLPVMRHWQCLGFLSMEDVVKELLSNREFVIDQLTIYITGTQFDATSYEIPVLQNAG